MPITTGRPPEVDDLLARARTLTPDELRGLAAGGGARIAGQWRRVACA
ncbi:MAG TPA: hypothetical protein VES19_03885 [Candidatus Limnocylindrales bacterium]|nr:hypothetical protein [Candidatus Limnocylindrales bacterium]